MENRFKLKLSRFFRSCKAKNLSTDVVNLHDTTKTVSHDDDNPPMNPHHKRDYQLFELFSPKPRTFPSICRPRFPQSFHAADPAAAVSPILPPSDEEEEENKDDDRSTLFSSRSLSDSFAVVKRSSDPYGDFRASMLEMILEKQMFGAKDLEKLLECFLSLNSDHHHGVIIHVFTEICEALFSTCKA
nr:transcription repressor OFP8-like [Ipomoea batatas]